MRLRMIDDWRKFHRFWSVRLSLLGSGILAAFFAYPEAMLHIWGLLPADLKTFVPAKYAPLIPVSIIISGVLARIIKQESLQADPPDDNQRKPGGQ